MATRTSRALILLAVAALLPSGVARGEEALPVRLGLLVDQTVALFPHLEGEVIEVRESQVTLSLGRRDGVEQGITLELYREGRELRHPKTGELLGRAEEPLGLVTLTRVFEGYSTGEASGAGQVRGGDKVRLSAGKIKLTVLSLSQGVTEAVVEGVVQQLVGALNRTNRFRVMLGDRVAVWLAKQGINGEQALAPKILERAARQFDIRDLLVLSFTRAQRKPYMEVRLFSFPSREPLLSTALFVSPPVKPLPARQFSSGRTTPPPAPRPSRSLLARLLGGDLKAGAYSAAAESIPLQEVGRLDFPVVTMDVAFVSTQGDPRVAVSDGKRVTQYRLVENRLVPEWTHRVRGFGRILTLQLADLDGDGVLELITNRHDPEGGMDSTIFSTSNGRPVPLVKNIRGILLAVDADGDGLKETLWSQRYDPERFFVNGAVDRLSLSGGALVSQGRVHVPDAFRATGATLAKTNAAGQPALVFIDSSRRLAVSVDGQAVWRSSTAVGKGGPTTGVTIVQSGTLVEKPVKLDPRPLAVDLDGDGIEEVVVPQNQAPGMLAVVFKGPAGYRLHSVNSGFEGTITGLGAIRGEGSPVLIAAVVHFKGLLKTSGVTQIIMTAPPE